MSERPPDWLRQTLPPLDGRALYVRPLEPGDARRERDFIGHLSTVALHQRVLGSLSSPSDEQVAQLVELDWPRRLALALLHDDRIIAVARFGVCDDPAVAEFAIVVADHWQARGLGHRLLARLVRAARAAGYRELVGTTFAQNAAMIGLARSQGFSVESEPGDPALRRLRLALVRRRRAPPRA